MIKKFNYNHLIIPGHLRNEKRTGKEPVKIPCNISAQESIKKCWSCLNYTTKGKQTNKQKSLGITVILTENSSEMF